MRFQMKKCDWKRIRVGEAYVSTSLPVSQEWDTTSGMHEFLSHVKHMTQSSRSLCCSIWYWVCFVLGFATQHCAKDLWIALQNKKTLCLPEGSKQHSPTRQHFMCSLALIIYTRPLVIWKRHPLGAIYIILIPVFTGMIVTHLQLTLKLDCSEHRNNNAEDEGSHPRKARWSLTAHLQLCLQQVKWPQFVSTDHSKWNASQSKGVITGVSTHWQRVQCSCNELLKPEWVATKWCTKIILHGRWQP